MGLGHASRRSLEEVSVGPFLQPAKISQTVFFYPLPFVKHVVSHFLVLVFMQYRHVQTPSSSSEQRSFIIDYRGKGGLVFRSRMFLLAVEIDSLGRKGLCCPACCPVPLETFTFLLASHLAPGMIGTGCRPTFP